MGDILHGMPAVAALRNALPGCEIGWAIEPHWSPLLQSASATAHASSMPLVNRIHTVPTREWKGRPFSFATLRQVASLGRELRALRGTTFVWICKGPSAPPLLAASAAAGDTWGLAVRANARPARSTTNASP